MKITFLSDAGSWKNPFIEGMAERLRQKKGHRRRLPAQGGDGAKKGDILFILGFFKIVPGGRS